MFDYVHMRFIKHVNAQYITTYIYRYMFISVELDLCQLKSIFRDDGVVEIAVASSQA